MSTRISQRAFSALERRRSTILEERRRTQTHKPYDIYDDADNLRSSNNHLRSRPSNSSQFQYDNPGFKQDENI